VRCAIIPAAGIGRRFGGKKQFYKVKGIPIIEYTLRPFQKSDMIDFIVLVVPKEDLSTWSGISEKFPKIKKVVAGGIERQESLYIGLKCIDEPVREVVIHDGVRPLLTKSLLEDAIIALRDYDVDGVITGVRPKDTVKEVSSQLEPGDFFVSKTLDRDKLILVQTPQVFKFDVLLECHEMAKNEDFLSSDDSALLEKYGYSVVSIAGDYMNIKVTTPEDVEIVSLFV